ncbi:hypothetical protein E2C01_076969 [Portunus trituberculatus]|uniref:Uncharacterized protein n=1 Tax=Portunus trituberculatus TaxID=210409 RepID=A0A5B7IA57_PORTR|nr:hypothetical protein [Portunus trituberculatus]
MPLAECRRPGAKGRPWAAADGSSVCSSSSRRGGRGRGCGCDPETRRRWSTAPCLSADCSLW